jgi:hypothetical protein
MEDEVNNKSGNIELKGFNINNAYAQSFGYLADGTTYVDRFNEVDMRSELKSVYERGRERVEAKALSSTSGGVGTAGYALVPISVDNRLVDYSRKYTPLVELIPRVTNQGHNFDFNVVSEKGAAYTRLEDGDLVEKYDTEDRKNIPIKRLYSVGRVTGFMQAGMPSYMLEGFQSQGPGLAGSSFADAGAGNAIQKEVLTKARSLKEGEENLVLNGNSSSSHVNGNPDGTEFDGIITLQSTTNQNAIDSLMTWDGIEDTVRYAFDEGGRPNVAVMGSSAMGDLRKIMRDQFRWAGGNAGTVNYGIPSAINIETMVGPTVAIPSMFMTNVTTDKQAFFLDMNFIETRVLQDTTYEELAKNNDSRKFMIKEYIAVASRAPSFNSYMDDLT